MYEMVKANGEYGVREGGEMLLSKEVIVVGMELAT